MEKIANKIITQVLWLTLLFHLDRMNRGRHGPKHIRPVDTTKRITELRPGDAIYFKGHEELVTGVATPRFWLSNAIQV